MLLNFYDSYWNNDFVEGAFEEREHGGHTYDTFVGFFAIGPFRDAKPNEQWAEVIYDD